jgi:glycosyltransferase involved in cell wall biosynthesis
LGGTFGEESLAQHVEKFFGGDQRGGLVFTLLDVWVLDPAIHRRRNTVCWVPVDHEPAPPRVTRFLRESRAVPVAMTRNGQELLAEFSPLYVPHGIDTRVMRPLGREFARTKLGIEPDAFLVGQVAANKGEPSRKNFVAVLQAFAEIRRRHENALLYLHTDISGRWTQGVQLAPVMEALDLPPDSVRFADQYRMMFEPISPPMMALLYSAMDVLVNPSSGEGFGLPILEALACGVPTVTTDFTAMRELGEVGWKVGGARQWTPQRSWQMLPRVSEIVDALEECYQLTDQQRTDLSEKARAFALDYDVGRVFTEHMLPALEEAQERFGLGGRSVPAQRKWSVSIVTPWRDHPEFTDEFWKAMDAGHPDQVLVIDDASTEPIKEAAYRFDEPTGFVRACNKGLELATGDVVIFLNNDIRLVDHQWLDRILQLCEPGALVGEVRDDPHCWVDGIAVPYIDGWCLAGMRQDLEQLGGFDEAFAEPSYYGDNDLSMRAAAGGMILVSMRVGLEHIVNGTTDDDPATRERATGINRQLYEQRVRDLGPLATTVAA